MMTAITYTVNLKKTVLASVIGLCLSQSCFALQEISDENLSQTTGEGIALLPTDFSFQLNGATSTTSTSISKTDISDNSNPGTGYLHIVPVGPLSSTIQTYNQTAANKIGKADIYLYGLALSKNDNNVNTRYSGTNISSWGTAANPWILKVLTASNIPNFAGTNKNVSYLTYEAPLYDSSGTSDDYNLKLGLWADAFVRDPSKVEGNAAEFCLNGSADCKTNSTNMRANRIRLQGVWNGLSVNGSNLKLFQTLDGSTVTSYNNTLGLAALLRFNTLSSITTSGTTQKNTTNDNGVLRLSTQETTASPNLNNLLNTPAIDGGVVPIFNSLEGLYLYNAHINLALGSLYQPVILGVADDGKNIVLEVTRIPNVAAVYNQIYTDYSNTSSTTYLGSTCSQFECGTSGTTTRNPTHSSITVGDVAYSTTTKSITADTSATAKGITFKDGTGTAVNLGSAAIDGVLIQHMKITTKGL
ncbi:hypothetical protein IAE19_11215 [Acinetobacter sp. S40]|uniref:hypothetical protein n=1 Tax=unclassified Acinetobacter TaxID=196816 RepID=UPI00190BA483|nr:MULTISPECIES: hypothetical protein [unclassified Acinetobacter]MBJ9986004.1 hypothetical protein [Acinetobacter sp. S40]MBK0063921.1 hypothetical protein [Acinetobacter sp. S55]MBK0067206.1 hypothetical protein [Acinetobacter sp. S54]